MKLSIIEHQNQRVLTTNQLADSYGTDNRRISENFNANKKRYKEGKHYILLEGEDLKRFGDQYGNYVSVSRVSRLYLWTEKGAWLHAKSLNTDRAWDAYEMLVDDYYDKKSQLDVSQLSPELQIMNNMLKSLAKQELANKEMNRKIETVTHRLDNIDSLDTVGDLQQRLNAMVRRYAQENGIGFGNAWKDFRSAFNVAYRTNLKLVMNHYKDKHALKKLTMPQYLSLVERLPDAIRVADKMLNASDAS